MATKLNKANQISNYLNSDEGKRNAERFLKAVAEKRLFAVVKHVNSAGTSRQIFFGEINQNKIYQFNWFFACLGYRFNKNSTALIIGGCGMDMVFNTFYNVVEILAENGFNVPENWTNSVCQYESI